MSSKKSNISELASPLPQDVGVGKSTSDPGAGRIRLEIESLSAGGRGVGRYEGVVWFVTGALPGDVVTARPVRRRERYVEATAVAIETPSSKRREPACALQKRCGGCPWMPMDETLQREWKVRLIRDALGRIGGLESLTPEPVRTPSKPLGYRNRMEFALCWGGGAAPVVGFHGSGPRHEVLDVSHCPLQHDEANGVLESVRAFLARHGKRDAWRTPKREQARLLIRRSDLTGEILVALRESSRPLPEARELASFLLSRHETVVGVVRLVVPSGRRGGTRAKVLAGRDWIEERVAGARFRLSVASFLQVSAAGAEELVKLVAELAGDVESTRVVELYGGAGLFSMALVRRGARSATVCEADPGAVQSGREAALEAAVGTVDFVCDDVRNFVAEHTVRDEVALIVANPPRSGLGKGVAGTLRSWGAARIILVSCDPPTLARDLKALVEGGAYRVERVVPVDLFPQTAHVETVALLKRC
jgi:23S rRNA (uracil1939-C5)-methyltransferase